MLNFRGAPEIKIQIDAKLESQPGRSFKKTHQCFDQSAWRILSMTTLIQHTPEALLNIRDINMYVWWKLKKTQTTAPIKYSKDSQSQNKWKKHISFSNFNFPKFCLAYCFVSKSEFSLYEAKSCCQNEYKKMNGMATKTSIPTIIHFESPHHHFAKRPFWCQRYFSPGYEPSWPRDPKSGPSSLKSPPKIIETPLNPTNQPTIYRKPTNLYIMFIPNNYIEKKWYLNDLRATLVCSSFMLDRLWRVPSLAQGLHSQYNLSRYFFSRLSPRACFVPPSRKVRCI